MIYIPDYSGSSKSITSSLGLVYDVYEKYLLKKEDRRIVLYKDFINNNKVKEEYNNLGITTIYNINEVSKDDIVILNSFGVNKKIYDFLNSNNIEYYDGTNKSILKLQKEIINKYNDGYEIIFVGNNSDIELINLNSFCNNNGIFLNTSGEFVKLSNNSKKYIICSSLYDKDKFKEICKVIENNYECILEKYELKNDMELVINSSIKTSNKCDLMIVVGDPSHKETITLINHLNNTINFNDINEFMKYILTNDLPNEIGITGSINVTIKELYNYKYLLSFVIFYKNRLKELKNNQDNINNTLLKEKDNNIVKEVVKDFIDLNKDGKYIRGTLIALGEYLSNKDSNNYLNLAYAYEMFQTSVLIHDDIIDNAKIRRGKETIPRRICHKYLYEKNSEEYHNDTLKLANSIGICAGDLGFFEANKLIIDNYKNNVNLSKILDIYNNIVINTIKGEIIDVTLPFINKYNYYSTKELDIIDIYHLKTSFYTIIGPVMLGYALNGKDISPKLKDILNKIGLSFQIKDDILGIFSDSQKIGKSNISDIEEFKQTLLYSHIINTKYKNEFLKIYGKKNIIEKDLEKIRELLKLSGSIDYALDYLDNLSIDINNNIDELDIDDSFKDILKGLLIYINIREK